MQFLATPKLLYLLHSQLDEFPGEAKRDPWDGCTVYAKLAALDSLRGGHVEIDDVERRELVSLLDSIVGSCGWDYIEPGEKRTGRAALKQLQARPSP